MPARCKRTRLFGQSRLPKPLRQQLRVCLPAPSDPRRYCKGRIDLKQARRRLTRLSVAADMGESRRETAVGSRIGGVQTMSFLPCDNGLVKATKLSTASSGSPAFIQTQPL